LGRQSTFVLYGVTNYNMRPIGADQTPPKWGSNFTLNDVTGPFRHYVGQRPFDSKLGFRPPPFDYSTWVYTWRNPSARAPMSGDTQ
jgi:hypothetical protein